ncbi:MAG TPA: L-dopachrome tautomerase-related protein [Archangium sp.]|uniref:SMP-30/gluconolactonase/LRE family protein n=1 Tax=Archangium sp. TaxID=1872627 RepID=UPI002E3192E9|nr:L-dopachrome tautomerase-related protein [Archangium sp.]HEX5747088.1 L-dopachrome tautomerase-related protein [Archangium sp.]
MKRERRNPYRFLGRAALVLVTAVLLALAFVKLRHGLGQPYPDVSTKPLVAEQDVRVLVELELPPGNVTGSRDGRIFFNTHPFSQSHRFTDAYLFELVGGEPRPFPDAASQQDLRFVFGMTVDTRNHLWLTSPATLEREKTRIIAYDLASNRKVLDRELPPGVGRFAQDLRVSPDGRTLFLADTGAFRFTPASLLVVDVETWSAREVLAGDPSTQPQDWVIRTHSGPYRIGFGLLSFQVGVDGLALSADGDWLYFATMSHDTLYRVRTAHLLDARLSPGELARGVEKVGPKPLSDGIEVAPDGSILITDVENGGVARVDTAGHLETLVRLGQVVWADGVHLAANGDVLFTDSGIPSYIDPLLRPPEPERLRAGKPYRIYRFHLGPG